MSELDLDLVVAEILVEAQRRRDSGEIPEELERELDAEFARHAPPGVAGEDFAVLLDRAERASYVDVDVPTASRLPAVSLVKRSLRKLMAWYLRYVAQQVTVVGGTLTRAVRLLDERVRDVEDATTGGGAWRAELERTAPAELPEALLDAARAHLRPATGRVLVLTCGRGALVGALRADGVGAYGVEPRRALLAEALRQGLDVRPDEPLAHLRALPERSLGGLVLLDVVEWLPPAALLAVAAQAQRLLVPGAPLAVLSATPEAWATGRSPVQVDLAPGRPWQAATWSALLAARGFTGVDVHRADAPARLVRLTGDDAMALAFNTNAEVLEPLVAPVPAYLVTASRSA